uniref:Chromophore lyase CpcS/CpeS n=1 Tax=Rhodogorgon sp. TaxID=2485824 RepID=A0A3G3MI38_9FLOR|nr:hypothetical protein [Rhodogorgon sp.]
MNINSLINHIEGSWLIQTTIYDLSTCKLKNKKQQVLCQQVNKNSKQLKVFKNRIGKSHTQLQLYSLKYGLNTASKETYLLFFFEKSLDQGSITKYTYDNKIISDYVFFIRNNNHIHIKSAHRNFHTTEDIYFINSKFKIAKSTISKNNKCITVCFSSKIKMN